MKRIMLTIAYDGTKYHGWQIQPNAKTVEEVLNQALSELLKETIVVIGASRTDSGVHALGNVAVFDTDSKIPSEKISYALNQRLPEDIVCRRSKEVPIDFHPRHCHSVKTYQYKILNSDFPIPTTRFDRYFIHNYLNLDAMKEAGKYFIGEHDFKSFCSVNTQVLETTRTIYSFEVEKEEDYITITITGNGFLYNMVRIIAGTLIEIGKGYHQPTCIIDMINSKDRSVAGATAPALGLTLKEIRYSDLDINI